MRHARVCIARLKEEYEKLQVELHGKYSVERMAQLHEYSTSTSLRRCTQTLLLSPLPCLVMILLVNLVPLNPASEGVDKNGWFWCRAFVVACCIVATLLEQMRIFVPRLPDNTTQTVVWMTLVMGSGSTLWVLWMATLVGFPVPFSMFFSMPITLIIFGVCVLAKWGRFVYQDCGVRQELNTFFKVVIIQASLTIIYPAYNYLFLELDGFEQTAFAIVLPLIKLVAKNALGRVFQHLDDYRPEVVIFNVEIFHALFVSCAMQGSTTMFTTAVLMGVDIVHAWMNLLDADTMMRRLAQLTQLVDQSTGTKAPSTIIQNALIFIALDPSLHRDGLIRLESTHQRLPIGPAQVLPAARIAIIPVSRDTKDGPESGAALSYLRRVTKQLSNKQAESIKTALTQDERRLYVTTTLQVLHFAEFIMLIEFVEVAVPLIYTVYIAITAQLPNHVYFPQLASMDSDKLTRTVMNLVAYVILELVSFIGLCVVLQRRLRISPLRQLVFVLRKQWRLVQSKMILWVLFAIEISLEHFGYDYTFQFQWLRAQPAI